MDGIESSDKSDKKRQEATWISAHPEKPQNRPGTRPVERRPMYSWCLTRGWRYMLLGLDLGLFGWGHGVLWPLASPSSFPPSLFCRGGGSQLPNSVTFTMPDTQKDPKRHPDTAPTLAPSASQVARATPPSASMCGAPARRGRETAGSPCGYTLGTPTGRQGSRDCVVGEGTSPGRR